MPVTTVQFTKSAKVLSSYPNVHYSADTTEQLVRGKYLVFSGISFPSSLNFKKLTTCAIRANYSNSETSDSAAYVPVAESFDIDTLTYNIYRQLHYESLSSMYVDVPGNTASQTITSDTIVTWPESGTASALKYGVRLDPSTLKYMSVDTTSLYLIVTYVDEVVDQELESLSPTSGYVPKGSVNRFSWAVDVPYGQYCYADIEQSSATFYYKNGTDAWQSVSCGTNMYCDLPANTFTEDDVQWYVVVTTNAGTTLTSDTYTLSTEEATSTAVAVEPKNSVIEKSADNVFSWQHVISTGTAPTKSELQISTDGTTFSALATVNSSDLSVTISANTFTAGTKYWRVRTYNTDNVAGAWSDVVSFIVIGPPDTPVVNVSSISSRATVSWQATGQVGYQISVDDTFQTSPMYGAVYSYQIPYYLTDGLHKVYVRVQNSLGLWSSWGSVSFTVTHTEGSAITLTANVSDDVRLSWETQGSYDSYIVYRDDIPIYKTTNKAYTDSFACGSFNYYVKGIYSSDYNYGNSNVVSVTTEVETAKITAISSVDWLDLTYADVSRREISTTDAISSVTKYYAGADYPFVEIGNQKSKTISVSVAFKDSADEESLKELCGEVVCLKTIRNESCIGVLISLSKIANEFYSAYKFTISNVYYNEEIEI